MMMNIRGFLIGGGLAMLCIIKLLKRLVGNGGSVLMEFVIVLPIYICLFGMLFLIGDMGLKVAALAVGDRAVAFDAGDRSGSSFVPFSLSQWIEDRFLLTSDSKTYRADENFKGSWSWQAAGTSSFEYRLPSWGGGKLLEYPYLTYMQDGVGSADDLGRLVNGGSVILNSKDRSSVRVYNYYTLKRTELARGDAAYRNWSEGRLTAFAGSLDQYWHRCVYEEDFADSDAEHLEESDQESDELPSLPSERKIYKRYSKFIDWSK